MRIVSVLDKVAETISRYSMVRPASLLGVAVSGGIDSVCLLDILQRLNLREGWGLRLAVIHVNHLLRGAESDRDENFVRELAARHGVPFYCRRVTLPPGNLENGGRQARRSFFESLRSDGKVEAIATGHTRSDQAETVLFRILRGTGLTGLAGVIPVTQQKLIRPLLAVSRAELAEYACETGLEWREDATNADVILSRNRLRHEWLPEMERVWNPNLEQALAQLADVAWAEEDHWETFLARHWDEWVSPYRSGLVVAIKSLHEMDLATQRRFLRRVHSELRIQTELSLDAVDTLRTLARPGRGDGRVQAGGLDGMRSFEWVRFSALNEADPGLRFWSHRIVVGERVRVPGGEIGLAVADCGAAGTARDCLYNEGSRLLDARVEREALEVRSWRPGDRLNGQKVKQLFQEARVPLWQRRDWPVLVAGDELLWTRAFGVAERWKPSDSATKVLVIEEFPDSTESGSRTCLPHRH